MAVEMQEDMPIRAGEHEALRSSGRDRSASNERAHAHSRRHLFRFIAFLQAILFLAHLFLYESWMFSSEGLRPSGDLATQVAFGVLSVSFIAASLLAFRYTHAAVRVCIRCRRFGSGC